VPVAQSILADAFPPEKRGQGFALFGVAVVVAPVVGPTLGGWLADNFSWRWSFLINAPVGVLAFALIAFVLRESEAAAAERRQVRQQGAGFDLFGFVLVATFLGALEIVLDRGARGRLVRLILYLHGRDRLRGRVRADDPVGSEPAQPDDRPPDGRDAPVRRLLLSDAGDRRHSLRDHPVPAPARAAGFWLYGDLGRPRAVAGRRRHDGDDVRRRPSVGEGPAQISDCYRAVLTAPSMYGLTNVYGDLGFWFFARSRMLLGVGLPLIFIRIMAASYDGIPPDKTDRASAVLNAARNTGGAIGISLVSNVLWDREQFHQSRLVGQAIPSSVQYQDTLHQVTNYFTAQGSSLAQAHQQAIQWIGQQVQAQASFLGYMDAFWLLMLISLAAVPLALALRKVKLGGGGAMTH